MPALPDDCVHPLLILKNDGSRVWGLCLLSRHGGDSQAMALEVGVEPDDVDRWFERMRSTAKLGDALLDATYLCAVEAATLHDVMRCTPHSPLGQKSLLVYEGDGWSMGIWNHPEMFPGDGALSLSSVADFYGGPVSAAARARRGDLAQLRAADVLFGDYDLLLQSVQSSRVQAPFGYWEDHPGVRRLAQWWNVHGPESERTAAYARLYAWNADTLAFDALDPEEPTRLLADLLESHSLALFERPGFPTVVAQFMRGQEHAVELPDGYTRTFYADGAPCSDIGIERDLVDDAQYCGIGLKHLRTLLAR